MGYNIIYAENMMADVPGYNGDELAVFYFKDDAAEYIVQALYHDLPWVFVEAHGELYDAFYFLRVVYNANPEISKILNDIDTLDDLMKYENKLKDLIHF